METSRNQNREVSCFEIKPIIMSSTSLNFGGTISQNYEDYLGPFLFEPFATDLAKRLNFNGVNKALELACGTGRLTKHIADILPENAEFIATDLNPDMVHLAKTKVNSDHINWTIADMLALPFDDASFDLVICQFGVMLVPDHLKALTEISRVLKLGGKLVFNTWSDLKYNRLWSIGGEVLDEFLGKNRLAANPGPFSLGEEDAVADLLKLAGFSESRSTVVENIGEIESAENAAYGFIHGLPVGSFIQNKAPELLPQIQKGIANKLKAELGGHPLKAPQKAIVFEAVK
jgi:SAM-dependent methyltransferase